MNEAVIVRAARTPIGSFLGTLSSVPAAGLGAVAIRGLLEGIDPASIDEVWMGNVLQAGSGQNPARQAALQAGLPHETGATTVNQVCGSGLKAVQLAWQAIRCGDVRAVIAGGMESMSQTPYALTGARTGMRMGDGTAVDLMVRDGLWCATNNYHMGVTAENIRRRYGYTREQLDRFAFDSQAKAGAAIAAGRFKDEIIPVSIARRKGAATLVEADEHPRPDTTMESLGKLRPAFEEDGAVTAGNSSGINDGAAALMLMESSYAAKAGLKPLAIVRAVASTGVDPAFMGLGPISAVQKALAHAGLAIGDIDLFELNEAFAAQALAVSSELGLEPSRVNVNGGAIALGHPIGASGARILVSLLYELNRRPESRYGVAGLCIGGGQGIAAVVEKC